MSDTSTVNTTDFDFGAPSLRVIAEALDLLSDRGLPDGWRLSSCDFRDCLRPGARSGEILVEGTGPDEIVDEWDDDPEDVEPGEQPEHHVETQPRYWGFRIRIDQIGLD